MSNNKQSSVDKEFVPHQESSELKKLGFDEPCFGCFNHLDKSEIWTNRTYMNGLTENITAPTFSQAFRWFREKYKLHHRIDVEDIKLDLYYYEILEVKKGQELYISEVYEGINFKSYEEAELECLRKLIKIVKEKQNG